MLSRHRLLLGAVGALAVALAVSCAPEYRWCFFDGTCAERGAGVFTTADGRTKPFTEELIQARTFVGGRVVKTVTYRTSDMQRRPVLVDFNGDGKVDPVVGYTDAGRGVIQILVSYGEPGSVQYASLTLDGGENLWDQLRDVAVGDIDGDGNLDIVAACEDGVVYLHHPSDRRRTHVLPEWGQTSGDLELVDNTTTSISDDELRAAIAAAVGPGGDLDNYIVTVEQGYTSVEIGDFNNDGTNDIAAARHLRVELKPKPDIPVTALTLVGGSLQLLLNPGRITDGRGWTSLLVGNHERHNVLDREGARDLRAYDVDGDGDLDLISVAAEDQNVQIAWFENPGGPGPIDPGLPWLQHRIGSARAPDSIDVADVTGDGRADVIAASPGQMQVLLFVQPQSVADRGYDWYTTPIVTFESFEPRSIRAVDVNNDGWLELVVGGTEGALRYFEAPDIPTDTWIGHIILNFEPPGEVGQLGYGDLDGDGDIDIVAVVGGQDVVASRVSWIENRLIP